MKMKQFGLSESKLFYFHGIFKKKLERKSAKRTPHLYTNKPLSRNLGSAPDVNQLVIMQRPVIMILLKKLILKVHKLKVTRTYRAGCSVCETLWVWAGWVNAVYSNTHAFQRPVTGLFLQLGLPIWGPATCRELILTP